jgi:hypothetical protein
VLGFLFRKRPPLSAEESQAIHAKVLAHVIPHCIQCGLSTAEHEYRFIASTVLSQDEGIKGLELLSAIKNHQWTKVLNFQDWEGGEADAEVYLVRCPDGGRHLALISSPFILEEAHILIQQEPVDDPAAFREGLPDYETWHHFGGPHHPLYP